MAVGAPLIVIYNSFKKKLILIENLINWRNQLKLISSIFIFIIFLYYLADNISCTVNDVIYYSLCPHISKGYLPKLEGSDTVIKFVM